MILAEPEHPPWRPPLLPTRRSGLHITYARDRRLALRAQRTRSGFAPSLRASAIIPIPSEELWDASMLTTPAGSGLLSLPAGETEHGAPAGGRRVSFLAHGRLPATRE